MIFRQTFKPVLAASKDLSDLLSKERTSHERTWAKRQQIYNELGGKAAAIDGRIRSIIERSEGKKAKVVPLTRETAS